MYKPAFDPVRKSARHPDFEHDILPESVVFKILAPEWSDLDYL